MWLTDLAATARSSGLTVVEAPMWLGRGHGPMTGVRSVMVHHTAGPSAGDMPSLPVLIDGRPDLAGPLCHLGLARSGTVHVVAAGLAWHAGAVTDPTVLGNDWSIGIECEATGTAPWPPAQRAALVALCVALCRRWGLDASRVVGHKEAAIPPGRKIDPNLDMPALRADIAAVLNPATPGGIDVNLTDRLPDYYTPTTTDTLSVADTMAWGTAHAANARDAARDAARATAVLVEALRVLSVRVEQIAAKVGA